MRSRIFAALAAATMAGCVSQQSVDAERHFESTIPTCSGAKDCEIKWAAARQWLLSNMTMKLQHYAPDYMETFNPVDEGIGGRVTKDPVDDTTYKITVAISCAGFTCLGSMTKIKQSFNDKLNGQAMPAATAGNPAP